MPAKSSAKSSVKAKIGVLGASGYTGSELVRLLLRHPNVELALLTADRRAGQEMAQVFPQFAPFKLPKLVSIDSIDWKKAALDLAFCALPHATTQKVVSELLTKAPKTKVVDLSADFRLHDKAAYARWYGHEHYAPKFQKEAVYGLVEMYREKIKNARLVANPGCYTSGAQLAVTPLLKARAIVPEEIVIDAKSGMTGAGRSAKEETLFSEVSEGFHAYGVGHPDHVALRASFLIDKHGIVRHQVVNDLPLGRDVDEMLRMVDALQFYESHGELCPAGWKTGDPGMKASPEGVAEYLGAHAEAL